MKRRIVLLLLGVVVCFAAGNAVAKDIFYDVKVTEAKVVKGALPIAGDQPDRPWRDWDITMFPRAIVLGDGEAYFHGNLSYWSWPSELHVSGRLAVRAPSQKKIIVRAFVPTSNLKGLQEIEFALAPAESKPEARSTFYQVKREYYGNLRNTSMPGTAWFRHLAEEAEAARLKRPLGAPADGTQRPPNPWDNSWELAETYDLFTGGKALAENIQLDRLLRPVGESELTVDVATIPGITIEEVDWKPLIKGLAPKTDPLAAYIPADQHVLFFPTFQAMIDLTDEADSVGTPVLASFEPRSEDGLTKQRYQKQLCLSMSGLSRLFGPKVVASVAFTGSDPFLRMGSDVAVLFEAKNMPMLVQFIGAKQEAALKADSTVQRVNGKLSGGLKYAGVRNPDRSVSSYIAEIGNALVVTNSLAQLEAIANTQAGKLPSVATLGEYTFFRDRYKLGDDDETALLVVSDATIRRWCGPRWRIGDSRRLRLAGALAGLQARDLDAIASGKGGNRKVKAEVSVPGAGALTLSPTGVMSSTYGTLAFLTPVVELDVSKVSKAEAEAYGRFRDRYQSNWREFFDPIALRFSVKKKKLALDLTVMPLIASSDYREFIELAGGATMAPDSGDPHEDALVRFGMSLNPDSRPVREVGEFAVRMAPGLQGNALSWLGHSITVWADKDKFWKDVAKADRPERYVEQHFNQFPVAVSVEVSSVMKATAFLASVRAYIDQVAPGMTYWETKKYKGEQYVKIGPTREAMEDDMPEDLALYYAVSRNALIVTLNEDMLKRTLKRRGMRKKAKKKKKSLSLGEPWLGANLGMQADAEILKILEIVGAQEYFAHMRKQAWRNIPILNEWKRLYPNRNPVDVHEQVWHTRLLCPGGGKYVWSERWQTMESTVYGHPGNQKKGPGLLRPPLSDLKFGNFGLTFENDGLRARVELTRKGPVATLMSVPDKVLTGIKRFSRWAVSAFHTLATVGVTS